MPVGGEPHVDRKLVSVLVKDFCMDFKGKRIDDELLLLPVPLGVGEVRIVDFPRQLSLNRPIGKFISRLMVIASAFSAAESLEQALQIWAAWPLPENFSLALYSPQILQ